MQRAAPYSGLGRVIAVPTEVVAVLLAAALGFVLRLPDKASKRTSELEARASDLEVKGVEVSTLLATGMSSIGDQLAGIRTDMREDRRTATETTSRLFERITAVEGRIIERIGGVEQRVSRLEERTSNP